MVFAYIDSTIDSINNNNLFEIEVAKKKYTLKYERKMPEKEVLKMKSFVTNKGEKLSKTDKFKVKKISEKDKERIFEIIL